MQFANALQHLLDHSTDDIILKKDRRETNNIRALQLLLYSLGFGKLLNWNAYRADGDYGGGTTKALEQFLHKNELDGEGLSLKRSPLQLMLKRYHLTPAIRLLQQSLNDDSLKATYTPGSNAQKKLQELSNATLVSIAGNFPSKEEAQNILAVAKKWYGDDWEQALPLTDVAAQKDKLMINNLGGKTRVSDAWLSISFNNKNKGVWLVGEEKPADFIGKSKQQVIDQNLSESAVRVIAPVSNNEGNLEAINTWDNAFITFGMFQWTIGTSDNPGELAALLYRLKKENPDAFQEHFGQFDLDVAEAGRTVGFLNLKGEKIRTPAQKARLRDDKSWAFRFWKAGLDPRVQLIQILQALDRINSFYHHSQYRPLNKFFIDDLITSEYGVCLLLDHHVNRPGHLMNFSIGKQDILGQALKKAGLADSDPTQWETDEERRLIAAYLPLRFSSSMTHSKGRADNIKKFLAEGSLSDERGSFSLESTTSRSLFGPSEADFPLINFEEYEQRGRED